VVKSAADLQIFALLITSRIIIYCPVAILHLSLSPSLSLSYTSLAATSLSLFPCQSMQSANIFIAAAFFQFNLSQIFNQNNDVSEERKWR